MTIDPQQIQATTDRYNARERYRKRNERLIAQGRYLEADSPERVGKFLARRGLSHREATEMLPAKGMSAPSPLEQMLGTNDLMGVAFLERGLQVARTVGRIWVAVASGRPLGYGTGFMISPRLLITNNHVLDGKAVARKSLVEFNYEVGLGGAMLPTMTFDLDPDTFFFTDPHLDYTAVAVRLTRTDDRNLSSVGWNPLIEEEGKAIVSQYLNIIQHPNGEVKQVSMRENQLVDVLDEYLQYKTDTAPGSSGSPVYNDRWEVVGLHHSGVWAKNATGQILAVDGRVWDESMGEDRIKWIANEGVRISKLISHLRKQPMSQEQRRLFGEIFTLPMPAPSESDERPVTPASATYNAVQGTIAPDGTATWTIPFSVSIRLGNVAAIQPAYAQPITHPSAQPPVSTPVPTPTPVANDPHSILSLARRELGSRADVLTVRLGYVFKDGWITNERALVVTVRQKQTPAALREARIPPLPETYMGLPIEVTNPSIEDLVALARNRATAEATFSAPVAMREEITYTSPRGVPLKPISADMHVIAHVSPDVGSSQLSAFLTATNERLVVGMYDFGAPHIADALETTGKRASFHKLTLVMQQGEDVGEGTKADDLTDDQVVQKLGNALHGRFESAWVKVGRVNGWVASSYHIKVAVRDQQAFWLSSGNWQSSNQPDADPLGETQPRRVWLEKYNREWHAIVENPALAKVFETYLLHDFENNVGTDGRESLDLPDLLIPEEFFLPSAEERTASFKYFPAFDEDRTFTVTPLLTPDNYHENVLKLVQSAHEELLIQNQTFNAPAEDHDQLRELIDAVIAKQHAGISVRVIFRVLFPAKARRVIEDLKDYGFDISSLKVQKNCHTKGIVVDRKRVLLGSQNWSNDGVSVNRDASLLFEDVPLAEYFADIFDHDWHNLAKQHIGPERLPIEWVASDDKTPEGFVRINWKDYMEML
jgi:V8-like Glu-specific endopeptidase